ncbi:nucleotidyl transferase AbiEii/AbiGii toxin family protein [Thermococcus argininiproducens]|uniref:Nucleotidyl transferase AbiEii/AbiGii toxin family protein n=1 Tax=Thermococcus argininiproducens TaxID=2866384 RepID=A0A9E7MAJ1_9EURY|nr:nucleotidyl transferase AbiEii/AbiGii toxin family protein [Thermococcus argininiproducens]USH00081.1 nucleotidyl transferase AbiEii/AbiGii toxin family protein [Thermococcus argininiproducens]
MLRIAKDLDVILAGGWAVYHWLSKWDLNGVPSVDVDFLVRRESFEEVHLKLRELGYQSSGFRYFKVVKDEELPFLEERLNVDLLFDRKPTKLSFESPYVRAIFEEEYYSIERFEFEGLSGKVRVVLPEALMVLKLDIYSNPTYPEEKREKHWKDMVDIYSLFMDAPSLKTKVFENLYKVKPFSFEHLEMFFSKESRELMDVTSIIMEYVGLPFDREGLLMRIDDVKESLSLGRTETRLEAG